MSKETRKPSNNPFLATVSSGATGSTSPSTSTSQASPPAAVPDLGSRADAAVLNEELPPAYTPAADLAHGEATVEYGPRRPFQAAPPPLLSPSSARRSHSRSHSHSQAQREQQSLLHVGSSAADLRQRSSSSDLFVYPGNRQSQPSRPPRGRDGRILSPPPRHPSTSESSISSANSSGTGLSDFARDFYAAANPVSSEPVAPAAASSTSRYAPPSGQPPPSKDNAPHSVPDDGRPTKTPTPGHPLLLNDQILVYPSGHVCDKCDNTGYKHLDPMNPCRKCWSKYAKPYAGAMLYTTWPSTPTNSSAGSSTFQKPLPHLTPITASTSTASLPNRDPSNSPSTLRRPRSRSHSHTIPPAGPPPPPRIEITDPYFNPPPPGALVVSPGDPRIGGTVCWKCGGSGMVPFFLFDELPCQICRGVGRLH